jgi:hypothetical protein
VPSKTRLEKTIKKAHSRIKKVNRDAEQDELRSVKSYAAKKKRRPDAGK